MNIESDTDIIGLSFMLLWYDVFYKLTFLLGRMLNLSLAVLSYRMLHIKLIINNYGCLGYIITSAAYKILKPFF